MKNRIKTKGICLFLVAVLLFVESVDEPVLAAINGSVTAEDNSSIPSATVTQVRLSSISARRSGNDILFTWEFGNEQESCGVEINGVDAYGTEVLLTDAALPQENWTFAVSAASVYTKFLIRPYKMVEGEKRYADSHTITNSFKPKETQIRIKSIGSKVLRWIVTLGDYGCSGLELQGRDREETDVLLADLPATATTYELNGQDAYRYQAFILRPYIQNEEGRVYETAKEWRNMLYTGYFLNDGIVGVQSHTQAEIRAMYKKLSPKNKATKYKKKPKNKKPYAKGAVADSTLKNGLNTLNFVRYVAGISYNVKIKKSYQTAAQAAAVVNFNDKKNWISHYPDKPPGMKDSLYKEGRSASSVSNLGVGYSTLYEEIIKGWMSDWLSSNIASVGHRRWCLNPAMQYTGFGIDNGTYAMYAFDGGSRADSVHGVHWPAENTPLKLFQNEDPWSISMGCVVDKNVTVTLTRTRDKKHWVFTSKNTNTKGNYMNVSNGSFGQQGCIIFRPKSIKYKKGDKFTVTITGSDYSFSYDVNFFSL